MFKPLYWTFLIIAVCGLLVPLAGCFGGNRTVTPGLSPSPKTSASSSIPPAPPGTPTTLPMTGTVTTAPATLVSEGGATLNGNLSDPGNSPLKVYFSYGTDPNRLDRETASQSISAKPIFSQAISGLKSNTTYYFQAVAMGAATLKGSVASFTTAFINSDYYYGFLNADGTLKFTNKNDGSLILESAPRYYFNYGEIQSTTLVSPPNASFETDIDADGIPDGWTISKSSNIKQSSDFASDGTKSVKFDLTVAEKPTFIVSPSVPIVRDTRYEISIDSYYQSLTTGDPAKIRINWVDVNNVPRTTGVLSYVPGTFGKWQTTTLEWTPDYKAKSFQVQLITYAGEIAILYFDNLVINQVSEKYQTNGSGISSEVQVSGDNVIVKSSDDSNSSFKLDNEFDLNMHSPEITYKATIGYKKDVAVNEERFTFLVPSLTASVMMRDLNLVPFDKNKAYYSDYYSPKVVKFDNGLAFLGSDNMQSMKLDEADEKSRLSFYADYKYNHPYFNESGDVSAQRKLKGESYSSFVKFNIEPGSTPKTLVKTRQPGGYDATLIQTTHADDETTGRINAVAYGTADTTSPLYGSKGVVGHRLGWTKSVFVAGVRPPYQDLSIPAYKNLTDKLYHDGVEIIGHTITPTSDDRNAVGNGLKTLSQYGARNWIDHGINFEDIAHRGSLVNDPYYIVDLLINAGYRYVWTYLDYTYSIDMIDAPRTGFIDSYFYYNRNVDTGNQKLYLWSSIEVQNKPDLWYKTENIDNLINQRGIHIGHAYYAHALEENHAWWKNPATGKEEIYPDFEAALEYMAKKRTQGLLWTPTMSEAGDYWTSLANVLVERISDTQFRITNNNPASINGLTLLAEKDLKSALVEGTQITTFGAPYGPRELVIPTVASNKTVTVTIGY